MTNNITQMCVGIDISKDFLDLHIYPLEKSFRVQNSKQGIEKLLQRLVRYRIKQIVWEASGGYDYLLRKMIQSKSYKTWQVEAKRIKAFIVSEGVKAKTDKIDARMIALFAASKELKHPQLQQSAEEAHLKALARRRTDLVAMITKETNRASHPQQVHCKKNIEKHITFMEKQIEAIEKAMNELISKNARLNNKVRIIESIPGVGKVTATFLVSHMPELGSIDGKQMASLLGVAPFDRQSGAYKGNAAIKGGRFHVRNIMYMAALTAVRWNPALKAFYERLCKAGKKPKVALTAAMRKLIVILNIMLQRGEVWRAN